METSDVLHVVIKVIVFIVEKWRKVYGLQQINLQAYRLKVTADALVCSFPGFLYVFVSILS